MLIGFETSLVICSIWNYPENRHIIYFGHATSRKLNLPSLHIDSHFKASVFKNLTNFAVFYREEGMGYFPIESL